MGRWVAVHQPDLDHAAHRRRRRTVEPSELAIARGGVVPAPVRPSGRAVRPRRSRPRIVPDGGRPGGPIRVDDQPRTSRTVGVPDRYLRIPPLARRARGRRRGGAGDRQPGRHRPRRHRGFGRLGTRPRSWPRRSTRSPSATAISVPSGRAPCGSATPTSGTGWWSTGRTRRSSRSAHPITTTSTRSPSRSSPASWRIVARPIFRSSWSAMAMRRRSSACCPTCPMSADAAAVAMRSSDAGCWPASNTSPPTGRSASCSPAVASAAG